MLTNVHSLQAIKDAWQLFGSAAVASMHRRGRTSSSLFSKENDGGEKGLFLLESCKPSKLQLQTYIFSKSVRVSEISLLIHKSFLQGRTYSCDNLQVPELLNCTIIKLSFEGLVCISSASVASELQLLEKINRVQCG